MSKNNYVKLRGHLGKDAIQRFTEQNVPVLQFSIATNDGYYKDNEWQDITNWHNIVAFRKLAEKFEYLKKGHKVLIEGFIRTRKWEKDDGTTVWITEVVASSIDELVREERTNHIPEEPTNDEISSTSTDDMPF